MKEVCKNCIYYETMDINGIRLDKGFCLIQDLYTFVELTGTCEDYCPNTKKENT